MAVLKTRAGQRVPAVTTIVNRFKESGALIAWANKQGLAGKTLVEARKGPLAVGTVAHQWCSDHLAGRELTVYPELASDLRKGAERSFQAFCGWKVAQDFHVQRSECQLISETHLFGGVIDIVGLVRGKSRVLDLKTGAIYPDSIIQVCAYDMLAREADIPLDAPPIVLRIGKDDGAWQEYEVPESVRGSAVAAFLRMRELFDIDKTLANEAKALRAA